MGKIYRYECRRLLWNQFFVGLIAVLLCYGALVLRDVTILGVSHTAPFSPWSFGDYLCRMLPLLWIGALFFADLLYLQQGPAGGGAHRGRAHAACPLYPGPVRRRVHGDGHAGTALYRGSGCVLWADVRLVRLGEPGLSRAGDPPASSGVRPGQRMAAWAAETLAAVCLDGSPRSSGSPALARGFGTVGMELRSSAYPLTLEALTRHLRCRDLWSWLSCSCWRLVQCCWRWGKEAEQQNKKAVGKV